MGRHGIPNKHQRLLPSNGPPKNGQLVALPMGLSCRSKHLKEGYWVPWPPVPHNGPRTSDMLPKDVTSSPPPQFVSHRHHGCECVRSTVRPESSPWCLRVKVHWYEFLRLRHGEGAGLSGWPELYGERMEQKGLRGTRCR
jgi:hypothetical protein